MSADSLFRVRKGNLPFGAIRVATRAAEVSVPRGALAVPKHFPQPNASHDLRGVGEWVEVVGCIVEVEIPRKELKTAVSCASEHFVFRHTNTSVFIPNA